MRIPQGAEWIILLLIVVLLFGAKRLPDAARGLGRSLRIFKAETKALTDEGEAAAPAPTAETPAVTASTQPAPAAPAAAPAAVSEPTPPAEQRPS